MATTTSNFSWPIPQSTDLVKDGATAIASLGSGIDTSMAELKGGTTGQILSKTSNTDMDFTWVSPNPGDITGVTAGTGITGGGTSGDVTVSFDIANYGGGQKAAGKNAVINGNMDIWQRGTSYAVANGGPFYGAADRWRYYHNGSTAGTNTVSRQTFTVGQTDVPNNPTYFQRWTATTLGTSQTVVDFDQLIEDVSTFAGQTVTISFYVKASAAFGYTIYLEQNFGSGGSASVGTTMASGNTSTSWVKVTGTATLPSISGKTVGTGSSLRFLIRFSNPTAGATFDIANAQVEAGSTATPFQTATGTKQGELAACQRYYFRANNGGNANSGWGQGLGSSTTMARIYVRTPVSMRTVPTAVDFSTLCLYDGASQTSFSSMTIAASDSTCDMVQVQPTVASGLTQYRPYFINSYNSASAYLGLSAEL